MTSNDANIVLACRQATPIILKRLLEIAQDKKNLNAATKACEIILNRAFGRAPVTVNIAHSIVDRAQLEAAAGAILERRRLAATKVHVSLDEADGHTRRPPIAPDSPLGGETGSLPETPQNLPQQKIHSIDYVEAVEAVLDEEDEDMSE